MVFSMSMLAAFILGGLWRRWLGGWGGHLTRGVKMAVGVVVMLALGIYAANIDPFNYSYRELALQLWYVPVLVAVTMVNYSLGHGSYMDLGTMQIRDNEYLRKILDLVWREPPFTFKRDFLGLALNYSIAPAVAVAITGFWPALLAGPVVAMSYTVALKQIGRKYYGSFLDGFTAAGELAAGAFLWLAVIASIWYMNV